MIEKCFSFLLIFILISLRVEARISCNDECLTKTYCLSSDGSGVCSENNLVTAKFEVESVFNEYDNLQLTLKGYNISADDEKTIVMRVDKPGFSPNTYICYKSDRGFTYARFAQSSVSLLDGSSDYINNVLSCTWSLAIDGADWPNNADLIRDSEQSITLHDDSKKATVAKNTSELPIYHAQYYKCCKKVHGNDDFLLTFEQTERQIRSRLYYWQYENHEMVVTLTRKDGIELRFEFYPNETVKGYINNGTEQISIDQQITDTSVIHGVICSWAIPFELRVPAISIVTSLEVFDLQVKVYGLTVYTEKGVTLNK